jgi:thiamine biosynthesis lipoprotein
MKRFIALSAAVCLLVSLCSCAADGTENKFTKKYFDLFDTVTTVTAYDESREAFEEHCAAFYERLGEYHRLYDIYNTYDDVVSLCEVNANAGSGPVAVDERITELLLYGKDAYVLSNGLTNICLGSVLELWHEARLNAEENPDEAKAPDSKELKKAAKHTDINSLIIDEEANTVMFADAKLKLDVGAIAKGYAAEKVCEWAQQELWSSAVVSVGGNVVTFGYKNDDGQTPFKIAIENPDESASDYLTAVDVTNMSVVSSGDYQRYFETDGTRYCHIINPETLMPGSYMHGVSVICPSSALADALSTTLFNMPIKDGLKLVNSMDGVEAVWTDKDYKTVYSDNFKDFEN